MSFTVRLSPRKRLGTVRLGEQVAHNIVPHRKYIGPAIYQVCDPLIGTAAYWDGLWDNGSEDGWNVDPDDYGEDYGAVLFLNYEQMGCPFPFQKTE